MAGEHLEKPKFQDFTSDIIDDYTAKFQPFNKLGFIVSGGGDGDLSSFFP